VKDLHEEDMHLQALEEFTLNARETFAEIQSSDLKKCVSAMREAKKIFVFGVGHSGMFGRVLSMKLCHVGLEAYTVFDEINPPFERGDLLVAISQSGETETVLALARKAKKLGGKLLAVVSNPRSTLGGLSDVVLNVKKISETTGFPFLGAIGGKSNQNFLGMVFALNIYILFYVLVIMLARELGESADSINRRHANLQ
jgi:6-phospho-3-hexuloisomerase